jgi:hypothetical protein
MRQRAGGVAARIKIEEQRSGNVTGPIFGGWVASAAGQIPGAVQDPEPGMTQVLGKPVGGNECRKWFRNRSSQTPARRRSGPV